MTLSISWEAGRRPGPIFRRLDDPNQPDLALPARFTARWDNAGEPLLELDIEIEEGGTPVCNGVHVTRRPEGASLDGQALRLVPVATLLYEACAAVTPIQLGPTATNASGVVMATLAPEGTVAKIPRRSKRAITAAHLREVARVWRNAEGTAPVEAVQETFHVSYRTATEWVRRAREAGLIPPKGAKQ